MAVVEDLGRLVLKPKEKHRGKCGWGASATWYATAGGLTFPVRVRVEVEAVGSKDWPHDEP